MERTVIVGRKNTGTTKKTETRTAAKEVLLFNLVFACAVKVYSDLIMVLMHVK